MSASASRLTALLLAAIALALGTGPALEAQPVVNPPSFVLSDQGSEVYYNFAVVAGEKIRVGKEVVITGNLHSNEKADLKKESTVDGDVSAVKEVKSKGEVTGTVTEGAAAIELPEIYDEEVLRGLADRVFESDQTFTDAVIDDVVFVDGRVRFRGDLNGSGTVIATCHIRLLGDDGDSDSDSDCDSDGDKDGGDSDSGSGAAPSAGFVLDDDTRLSLISLRRIALGRNRPFRGVLRAGDDIKIDQGVDLEGVVVGDGKIDVKKESRITFVDFDDLPPVILLVAPPDGSFVGTSVPEVVIEYSDDFSGLRLSSLEFLVDGVDRTAEAAVGDTGLTYTPAAPLVEGLHTLEVAITDRSDSETRETFSFTVDVTPPVLAITSPSASFTNDATPEIVVEYADAISGVDLASLAITVDGVDVTPGCTVGASTATCESPPLADGGHTIAAVVSDLVGNAVAATFSFAVDATPPEITATLDPAANANGWNSTDVVVSFDCQDGLSGVASCSDPVTVSGDCVEQAVEGTVTDVAGNTASVSVTVRVDRLPPDIDGALDPPPNAAGWNNSPTTASFDATDGCSGVAEISPPVLLDTEGAGQEVTGSATDLAGNVASFTLTAAIDLTPPEVLATPDPPANAAGWNNTPVTVAFTCTDALSGVASCSPPVVLGGEGAEQPATGTGVDIAGNSASATASVSIDLTPPVFDPAELRPLPCPELTLELAPQVRACFADGLSGVEAGTVQLSVDGVDRTAAATIGGGCAVWDPPNPFAPGEHQATIAASDEAGNAGSTSWCFEVASPTIEIAIDSPAPGLLTRDATVDVSGTVEAIADTVEVNGVAAVVTGGTFQALGVPLREGKNVLTAVARNAGGGIGTASVTVTRDTTPPVVRIETPRDGAVLTSLQVDVAGLVNDISTGTTINADDCQVWINGVEAEVANRAFIAPDLLLKRGLNTLVAEARDRAGNAASRSIQVTVQDQAGQRVLLLAGNNQSGEIFTELPAPMIVVLEDANGDPVPGRPVTFHVARGEGTVSAFPQQGSSVTVLSDELGQASARFRLSGRSGAGNNRVVATAPGFLGEVEFCASATGGQAERITTVSGNGQRGIVERDLPLPLVALVTDAGGNPAAGVDVTFEVTEGGGSVGGADFAVVTTDLDGLAQTMWTLGPDEGINNNVALASFAGLVEAGAVFRASAWRIGRPADTRISGLVLDNQDNPVPGATVSVEGTALAAVSDAEGRFSISGVPVGFVRLLVDGSTTARPGVWPAVEFELTVISGRDNTLDRPAYLLPLAGGQVAGGDTDVTLTLDNVPGAELTVFANSVTCPDGSTNCAISVTQVRSERVPMEPPLGSSFMLAWTIQPAGAHFDPPARLCIPNSDMAPGQQVEMFSFDHDQGAFVAIGLATVTEDGSQICSDPGFGVVKAGWHGCVPPPPPKKCVGGCDDDNPCTDDRCEAGVCVHERNIPEGETCYDVEIEAEAIDQDDPENTTFESVGDPATVYGGSEDSTSDNLKLEAETDASVPVTSYTWSVTGPGSGSYSPSSSQEWDVGEINPEPGELEFKVVVQFEDGETAEDTLDVEVGVRTDDMLVIGWIDPAGVPLSGAGMGSDMLRYYPLDGAASMSTLQKGLTLLHLGLVAAGSTIHPVVPRDMTAEEKTHMLNWQFKFAGNFCAARCPPTTFADDAAVVSFRTGKRTSYKLFNRFQIKYLTDDGVTFKGAPTVIKQATAIGVTNNPVTDGEDSGVAGPNEGRRGILSNNAFLINDGTPVGIAVSGFNTLAAPLKWSHIGSRIEFSVAFGTDGMVFTQVYPTYYVFKNFTLIDTIPQAPNPIGNFSLNPYPPGPAPFIP